MEAAKAGTRVVGSLSVRRTRKLVSDALAAGARRVLAAHMYGSKQGKEFADALLVQLPESKTHRALVRNVFTSLAGPTKCGLVPNGDSGDSWLYLNDRRLSLFVDHKTEGFKARLDVFRPGDVILERGNPLVFLRSTLLRFAHFWRLPKKRVGLLMSWRSLYPSFALLLASSGDWAGLASGDDYSTQTFGRD